MDIEQVGDDTSIEDTADDSASTDAVDTTPETVDPEKYKELADNYKARAEKAEKEARRLKGLVTQNRNVGKEVLEETIQKHLEMRDLESLEYPDDIKALIKRVVEVDKTSVRKAQSDPYVAAKIDAWKKQKDAEDAALSRTNRSGGVAGDLEPPDVDMGTKEGRDAYDKWKADMIRQGY